jgi:hypothetical protein
MVSGGTYGTEDIVHGAGYGKAILILATHSDSLEPAHCIHDRRTLERAALRGRLLRLGAPRHGQFLGISGSMAIAGTASIFDMAIYPTLFVTYLTRMFPWFQENHRGLLVGLACDRLRAI